MLKRKINKKFLLASIKAALVDFSQVYVHVKGGFRNSFKNHSVTGSFFELVSDFKEATLLPFSPKKTSKN